MKTASWILLVLVALLIALASVVSLFIAYAADPSTDPLVAQLATDHPEAVAALRGRRGTAASFALAFSALFVAVVMGPYRRGEVWSWWALLLSTTLFAVSVLLRVPLLQTWLGSGAGAAVLAVVVVALLLDVKRLSQSRS